MGVGDYVCEYDTLTIGVTTMQRLLMYDCEIINLIPDRRELMHPDYSYCSHWRDFNNMGISVVGTWRNYDIMGGSFVPLPLGKYEAFVNDSGSVPIALHLPQFRRLQQLIWGADSIIGFNTIAFDDYLMVSNGFDVTTDYDLLCQTRVAVGQPPHYKAGVTTGGYSLANLAHANGMAKTGTGELAPMLWQDGKRQQVVDYCLNDVKLVNNLYWRKQNGLLRDPLTAKLL